MTKNKIALSLSTALLVIGVLAGTNLINNTYTVKATPKEYSVTYDAAHRVSMGSSKIVVNTELGNETYIAPTNCQAYGSYGICIFNDNGSYLDSAVPFQSITSIEVDYAPTGEHSLWLDFRNSSKSRIENCNMLDGTTANERITKTFIPTNPSNTSHFRVGSLGNCAIIYSITVHYTCE